MCAARRLHGVPGPVRLAPGRRPRRRRAGAAASRRVGSSTTTTSVAPASRAAISGHTTSGRPHSGCRTLGVDERMRVPSPAARITTVRSGTGGEGTGTTLVPSPAADLGSGVTAARGPLEPCDAGSNPASPVRRRVRRAKGQQDGPVRAARPCAIVLGCARCAAASLLPAVLVGRARSRRARPRPPTRSCPLAARSGPGHAVHGLLRVPRDGGRAVRRRDPRRRRARARPGESAPRLLVRVFGRPGRRARASGPASRARRSTARAPTARRQRRRDLGVDRRLRRARPCWRRRSSRSSARRSTRRRSGPHARRRRAGRPRAPRPARADRDAAHRARAQRAAAGARCEGRRTQRRRRSCRRRPRPSTAPGPQPLVPGSAVGVGLSSGDITIGAIGTVAYIDGDERVGVRAPVRRRRRAAALLLQDAYVSTIVNDPSQTADGSATYKLAGPVNDLGTLTTTASTRSPAGSARCRRRPRCASTRATRTAARRPSR